MNIKNPEQVVLSEEIQERLASGIVHIHPTRRCNLECIHCYSESSPYQNQEIPINMLLDFLDDIKYLNYKTISISGGEPLLYSDLPQLVEHAKSLNFEVNIVSNGTQFKSDVWEKSKSFVDTLAISLDGLGDDHNLSRNSPTAFQRLIKGLDLLNSEKFVFGFIHTLTDSNWDKLIDVVKFASVNNAKFFQIHPLEKIGRGMTCSQSQEDETILLKAYLLTLSLIQDFPDIRFQFDAISKQYIINNAHLVYVNNTSKNNGIWDISPIVLEPDGTISPFSYGFNRKYCIGNIFSTRLKDLDKADFYRIETKILKLCRSALDHIRNSNIMLLNWFSYIQSFSHYNRSNITLL